MCVAGWVAIGVSLSRAVPAGTVGGRIARTNTQSHFPTPETDNPYDNRTLYGAAKVFNEGLLRSFNDMHGLDYVALRYFNAYGPRMDTHATGSTLSGCTASIRAAKSATPAPTPILRRPPSSSATAIPCSSTPAR